MVAVFFLTFAQNGVEYKYGHAIDYQGMAE